MRCVNINHPEFKALLEQSDLDPISLAADISIWQDKNNTDLFPTLEQLVPPVEKVEYRFSAVDKILAKLPILNKWWTTLPRDTFWKKFKELGIPNEQVELYQESNADTFEQVVVDTLAKYSFDVEINTSAMKYPYGTTDPEYDRQGNIINNGDPTQYYSDLTVPGGTNYQELEIKTPQITPSTKGHAEFSTDKGIGWFRTDDAQNTQNKDLPNYVEIGNVGGMFVSYQKENGAWRKYLDGKFYKNVSQEDVLTHYSVNNPNENTVRRVLEMQSDLFQKSRSKDNLVETDLTDYSTVKREEISREQFNKEIKGLKEEFSEGGQSYENENYYFYGDSFLISESSRFYKVVKKTLKGNAVIKQNKFLQLLNKDGNWIKFFIQSIVADSKKKGYKNVLFPAGETAARIEGHDTLANEIRSKKEKLEKIDKDYEQFVNSDYLAQRYQDVFLKQEQSQDLYIIDGDKVSSKVYFSKVKELQDKQRSNLEKEISELKTQGIEKLKPIEGFYEVRVQNTLKKLYPDNVVRVTDEYGNDWFSVNLYDDRTGQVFFQKDKTPENKVSEAKLKSLLERTGFSLVTLQEYEKIKGKTYDVNALVDMSARLIAMAEGASTSALTEELAHIAVAQSRGSRAYEAAMTLLENTEEYTEFYDTYMQEYGNDLYVREEILGKILMKELEYKLGNSLGLWLKKLWERFISLFKNRELYDYVFYIAEEFITNPERKIEGDGVFFQLQNEEKALQQQVNKLNRRYRELTRRQKSNPSLVSQIRALQEELEGTKNGVGIYKFLKLLNTDTKSAIDFIKSYFTVTEKDGQAFLGARTYKETPSDNKTKQLAQYIGYYLPFLKELNMILDEDSVISRERKKILDRMIRTHVENFEVINRAYHQFLNENNRESIEAAELDIAGQQIMTPNELREAPRDSNFLETWFGLARNNSDTLVRLAHRVISDIKNKIRRAVLNWSDDFLANSIDYIGKDMSWVAERVTVEVKDKKGNVTKKIQKSGNFISEVHQGQWDLAREQFHTSLHDRYGFSQDFAERLKEKKTIESYKGVDAFQNSEIQKLKEYNKEIAKWYTANSIPNPRVDEIIAERKAALSPEQFEFWKLRNMELNKDGSVKYYRGELVSPSRGKTKIIEYGNSVKKIKTVDWTNKDYEKLSDKDKEFLKYLKAQKKEIDKSIPFAVADRLPQMYESTLDIMRLNEPEVFKRLGKNIKSSIVREEDDTEFNDTPTLNDGTILDDVPIRFTGLLSEPDRVTTDILSSLIAYKQMQENYVQMSAKLPMFENWLQGAKRRVVKKGDKVIRGEESWSFTALKQFLEVHVSGKEKEDLTVNILGTKVSVTKAVDKLSQWVRMKNLGFNFITMTSNLISSKVFATLESLVGNYTTVKSSAFANKEFFSILPTVISSFNGVRSTDRISSLMTYFGLGRDIREMFDDLDKHVLMRNQPDKTLMYGYEKGDYFTKAVVMIAILDNYRVKDNKWYTARESTKEGLNFDEMTSAYDMLKVDKDGKVNTSIPESVINNITARMKTISSRVDGSLSPEDKGAIYQNAVFSMVGLHRGWLFEGLSRRLKSKGYDFTLNQVTEGEYRTVMDLIGRFFMSKQKIQVLKNLLAKYNELEDYQKENLKRVMLELSMIAAFTIIALVLNSGDDDEEDYLRDLLAYQANRVLLEVSSFYNPNEFVSAIKDPIVPARDLELVTNFTDMFNTEVIERGKWEGLTKQQKYFLQLVPGIKGYSTLSDPESQNQFLRQKPLKPIYSTYEFFVGDEEK